jgi:transcriptional regulator with XRE-family HTH domain
MLDLTQSWGLRGEDQTDGKCRMTLYKQAESADVSDEGDRIRERRNRLGESKQGLARLAGVDRGTLANIEAGGHYSRDSYKAVSDALSQLELETGVSAPPPAVNLNSGNGGLIEFELEGDFGVRAVVRGPIADAEAVERAAARFVERIRAHRATPESMGDEPEPK